MILRIALALGMVFVTSCTPGRPAVNDTGDQKVDRPDVTIELTTEGLIYNGTHLNLGDPIGEWIDVLGTAREDTIRGKLIWDDLGIRAYTNSIHDDRVQYAAVVLRRMPGDGSYESSKPGNNVQPLNLYRGSLRLAGVAFDKDTIIRDLRADVYRNGLTIGCIKGTGSCYVSKVPRQRGAPSYIGFQADSRNEFSPVYIADVGRHLSSNVDE